MTNDEINKYIHVEIIGECWHELTPKEQSKLDDNRGFFTCPHCRTRCHCQYDLDHPDYCSDNSRRSLLNEVVAKVTDSTESYVRYRDALCRVSLGRLDETLTTDDFARATPVTAEQIARACVEAHKTTPVS